jgi:electron transport complex protein RnfB
MSATSKLRQVAIIRENECIGCTKCIQACPVDAILGSRKQMHTVIINECISCKLCIPPCPVDCIDMVDDPSEKPESTLVRTRATARKARLAKKSENVETPKTDNKQRYILDAIARAKNKKTN